MSPVYQKVTLERGAFVVSLDFELAWGTRGRPSASKVGRHLAGSRHAIDHMLQLFQQYGISATWAMVGGLLLGGEKRPSRIGMPKISFRRLQPAVYSKKLVATH